MDEDKHEDAIDLCIDLVLDYAELIGKKHRVSQAIQDELADELLDVLTSKLGVGD